MKKYILPILLLLGGMIVYMSQAQITTVPPAGGVHLNANYAPFAVQNYKYHPTYYPGIKFWLNPANGYNSWVECAAYLGQTGPGSVMTHPVIGDLVGTMN